MATQPAKSEQPPAEASTASRSRRACSDAIGNDYARTGGKVDGVKGCAICHNEDSYGKGDSVCGQCNRCHGCGSTNNGIGPLQAIYFGGKKAVKRMTGSGGKEEVAVPAAEK